MNTLRDAELEFQGSSMFALNHGTVCAFPSHALVQSLILDELVERAVRRSEQHRPDNPLDPRMTVGAQTSLGQLAFHAGIPARTLAS